MAKAEQAERPSAPALAGDLETISDQLDVVLAALSESSDSVQFSEVILLLGRQQQLLRASFDLLRSKVETLERYSSTLEGRIVAMEAERADLQARVTCSGLAVVGAMRLMADHARAVESLVNDSTSGEESDDDADPVPLHATKRARRGSK